MRIYLSQQAKKGDIRQIIQQRESRRRFQKQQCGSVIDPTFEVKKQGDQIGGTSSMKQPLQSASMGSEERGAFLPSLFILQHVGCYQQT